MSFNPADTSIKQSYLSQLSDDETEFAVAFLKEVFVNEKRDITSISDDQISILSKLFSSFGETSVKQVLIRSLHPELQFKMLWDLPEAEQINLFTYYADTDLLESIFQEFPQDRQVKILNAIHETDRQLYQRLKALAKTAVSMVGGILVTGQQSVSEVLAKDIKGVLAKLKDPKLSVLHLTKLGERFVPKYESQDLDRMAQALVTAFIKLKVPFKSKEGFMIYLKFFHFMTPIFPLFAEPLKKAYAPLLHTVIMGLNNLPDISWVMRVLNQFPVYAIMIILEQLMNYESLASFEKRNIYCKLFNSIHKHLKMKGADQIRFAFSKL